MAGIQGQAVSTLANEASKPTNQAVVAGGKDGALQGRPMYTPMGTPIVYGKSYIDNYTKNYVAPLSKDPVISGGDGGGNGGVGDNGGGDAPGVAGSNSTTSSADNSGNTTGAVDGVSNAPGEVGSGTVSSGQDNSGNTSGNSGIAGDTGPSGIGDGVGDGTAFANGTVSVPGYYNGTIGVDDDPWAWTKVQPVAAPLAAEIKPSNEQALGRMPDRVEQQLGSMVMGKGIDAATKGIDTAYKAYNAAPLAAAADAGTAIAATGTGSAATGAALAGGEAALAAMGPVGWTIGAGLLAKKLGIF